MNIKALILLSLLFGVIIQGYSDEKNNSSPIIKEDTNLSVKIKKIVFKGDINNPVIRLSSKKSRVLYLLTGKDSRYFYIDSINGKVYFKGVQEYEDKKSFYITGVVQDSLGDYDSKDFFIEIPNYVNSINTGLDIFSYIFITYILIFLFR